MMRRAVVLVLTVVVATSGCTSFARSGPHEATRSPGAAQAPAAQVRTSAPDTPLTVVADAAPVASAVSTSRALYDASEVVVLARDGDRSGILLGASAAVALGVPLLLEPASGSPDAHTQTPDPVGAELDRLGATTALAIGFDDSAAVGSGVPQRTRVVAMPADPAQVGSVIGVHLGRSDPVAEGANAAAIAALDPRAPVALVPAGTAAVESPSAHAGRLPSVERADPLRDTVVVATGSPESSAGLATARAAGARVALTGGAPDPRGSADVVRALSSAHPRAVVALGATFAGDDGLAWKLATAEAGRLLPGGGQLLFPGRMLVALYGHPGTPSLGVLGEQDVAAAITRARASAAGYARLVHTPVVPAFEIIATVASGAAGPSGNYSNESDPAELRPWVDAAGKAGLYVVLDLQPGRTDFLTQAKRYASLLDRPYVGLALDPEWRLQPSQAPLQQIGSVGVDEVNRVVAWLADFTRAHALPQKLLVLHQFQLRMVAGRDRLDTSRAELAVLLHADGQGTQGDKQATWRALHTQVPAGVYWGWKNFYDEDHPMLTAAQTVASVNPMPQLISYQ